MISLYGHVLPLSSRAAGMHKTRNDTSAFCAVAVRFFVLLRCCLCRLGENRTALDWLDRAYTERNDRLVYLGSALMPIHFIPILALRGSSQISARTKLCARTPGRQAESQRNSSTSCPVVVLLPFDQHVRGNSGMIRWPQSADNPLPGIRAKHCNVSYFDVPQGQN